MGKTNNVLRHYFQNKKRFADLFNGVCFQGADVIQYQDLTDASEVYTEPEKEEYLEYKRQLDDLRITNEEENTYENWAEKICGMKKSDKIFPVYTVCLYHGEEQWDGPRCLKDMMNFGKDESEISSIFTDYPMRLYCINEIDNFDVFQTEIKQLFQAAHYRKNKEKLRQLIEKEPEYQHMDADTLEAMSVLLNIPKLWENRAKYMKREVDKEEYNMCQALMELQEEARNEGIEKGIEKGTMDILISLVNQGLLQVSDAARQIDMEEDEFLKKMDKL